jgi:putative redox protein
METARVLAQGALRTEVIHLRSGQRIFTDAPIDNQGKGESISPTDMLAASLAACCLTTMEIKARASGTDIGTPSATVRKHMVSDPRRISRIEVLIELDGDLVKEQDRGALEHAAHHCPVALSLSEQLIQDITFHYV